MDRFVGDTPLLIDTPCRRGSLVDDAARVLSNDLSAGHKGPPMIRQNVITSLMAIDQAPRLQHLPADRPPARRPLWLPRVAAALPGQGVFIAPGIYRWADCH